MAYANLGIKLIEHLDPLEIAGPEEVGIADYVAYVVSPSKLYPAAIGHILDYLEHGWLPGNQVLCRLLDAAKQLPPHAWVLALTPVDIVADDDLETRARALEIARLWFTELLHAAVGYRPMLIHITYDSDYKLAKS